MKMNQFKSTIWLFLFSVFAMACSTSKSVQKDKDSSSDSKSNLLIYIQETPCMGKCPDYEAYFYTGKRMTYDGRSHMPILGRFEYLLPPDLTKNLIYEAVKMNIKLVPDNIPAPPDVAIIKIGVVINGKMKNMIGWKGSGNDTFDNFVDLVHKEVIYMISDQEGIKMP